MSLDVRVLVPGQETILEAFLRSHAATTMFLRSNLRAAGLVDRGQTFGATWVGAFDQGQLLGVAALCWNGILLLQTGSHTERLVRVASRAHPRQVVGLIGPWDMAAEGLAALGLDSGALRLESREDLFTLDLEKLSVPPLLQSGAVSCRPASPAHLELMSQWSAEFGIETMGEVDGPGYRRHSRDGVRRSAERGELWELLVEGRPVSTSNFNARLPDCVQIGGVWTPEPERGKGYARSVVAGSLLAARDRGVVSSVLFTRNDNEPARRAYESLGYRKVGDYGILLFREGYTG